MNFTYTVNPKASDRQKEIIEQYIQLLDAHIQELKNGTAEDTLEVADFAKMMHLSPRHLSNTIHDVLDTSPCGLYEERLMNISKELILSFEGSIASIARHLMYDPSNFSKFFKSYEGVTPKQYRELHLSKNLK